jgi:hypothetical protein
MKEKIIVTLGLDTMRSLFAIVKKSRAAELPTPPDATVLDGITSELVVRLISPPNNGLLPIIKPCRVIETKLLPSSVVPPIEIIIVEEFVISMAARLLPKTDMNPVITVIEFRANSPKG